MGVRWRCVRAHKRAPRLVQRAGAKQGAGGREAASILDAACILERASSAHRLRWPAVWQFAIEVL